MENEILQQILSKLESMDGRLDKLEQGQTAMHAEMIGRFDKLNYSLNEAWKDIGLIEDHTKEHEREFHRYKAN